MLTVGQHLNLSSAAQIDVSATKQHGLSYINDL